MRIVVAAAAAAAVAVVAACSVDRHTSVFVVNMVANGFDGRYNTGMKWHGNAVCASHLAVIRQSLLVVLGSWTVSMLGAQVGCRC